MKLTFSEASSLLKRKIALRVTFHNNITARLLKIRGGASPPRPPKPLTLLKMFFEVAHIRIYNFIGNAITFSLSNSFIMCALTKVLHRLFVEIMLFFKLG
jgi:hypothetical protein